MKFIILYMQQCTVTVKYKKKKKKIPSTLKTNLVVKRLRLRN